VVENEGKRKPRFSLSVLIIARMAINQRLPRAMAGFLEYRKVCSFDFSRWAEPLRVKLRENAGQIAVEAGLHIEYRSFMQAEYATDVVFRRQAEFQPLCEPIVRSAVHIIKAEHVATLLGRKLSKADQG
jgi:hypothetical protein